MITDALARPLHDLRISVTDRCNFRCVYCMPKEVFGRDFAFMPREQLLTFEEIVRITRLLAKLGVEKVRITGGEPLLRRDLEGLIAMIASIDGIRDLTLTTNGSLLTRQKAQALSDAGLRRITISLDSLDDAVFRAMNDVSFPVDVVLRAIESAEASGLSPIKIDMVVRRGMNEHSVVDMARHFRGSGHIVRFIEYMDVGTMNGWRMQDVVSGAEIREMIGRHWPLEPVAANYLGEVAQRWRYTDGAGEIGVISSVTEPFCGNCTRLRLSADGELFTCLFADHGYSVRDALRKPAADDELSAMLARLWASRRDRYSEIRSEETAGLKKVEMYHIGG